MLFFSFCFSPVPDYVQKAIETVLSIHKNEQHGDILVFLTGQDEVQCFYFLRISCVIKYPGIFVESFR